MISLCQLFVGADDALSGIYVAVHLGNKVICYQLSPLTLEVTVNSRNATKTILSPWSVPETVSILEMNLWNIAENGPKRGPNPSPLAL